MTKGIGGAADKKSSQKKRAGLSTLHRASQSHMVLAGGVFAFLVVAGIFSFAAWQHWKHHELKVAQRVVDSKFDGIHVESNTYANDRLQGYVAYVLTENTAINESIRRIANAYFLPCKEIGLLSPAKKVMECNANFEIDFATADYIGITYTFRQHMPDRGDKSKKISLLYDRHTGRQITIADVFKPDAPFLETLSRLSRAALTAHVGDKHKDQQVQAAIAKVTEPQAANFNNFSFTADEKLVMTYNDIAPEAGVEGMVPIVLPPDELYPLFDAKTVQAFFPKLREQKEAERKLAEEVEAQRRRTRNLVGANRSNVNCAVMKCIALTYDDGPHATNGPRLLNILKERGAVATFFVLGSKVAAHTGILQRAVAEGNEIGNHSWSHANLTNLSAPDITNEIRQTEQAIFNATGRYSRLMRPPYGAHNAHVVASTGLPMALWNIDTFDWRDRDPNVIYQRVVTSASPGSVVLMHEIHQASVDAAPRIIDELQRQGYVLVTVSELFGITGDNLPQFNGQVLRRR